MPVWTGLIGPTYTLRSSNVDAERCMNLYPEAIGVADYYGARILGRDAGGGKTTMALYGVPGLTAAVSTGDVSVPTLFYQDGRAFAVSVSGTTATLREIASDYTLTTRGTMIANTTPPTISSSGTAGHQLFITCGGPSYIFDLTANTLTPITDSAFAGSSMGGVCDEYFLSLVPNSNQFQICDLLNGLNWSTGSAGTATREEGSDNWNTLLVDHRAVWLWGTKTSVVYYDSGNTFPFDPVQGAFLEMGNAAPCASVRADNTVCWIGQSERGDRVAYRAAGYVPQRISTYAVELAWRQFATVADAVGYAYDLDGHSYWVVNFPTAQATWVYDFSTQLWHERGRWDPDQAAYVAYPGISHCFAWGTTHLVGGNDGTIYIEDPTVYTFGTSPIRWLRQSTYLSPDEKWASHRRLQVDAETGVGLATGQGSTPQMFAQYSDDGAHTWSPEDWQSMGANGQYQTRLVWSNLGQSRERVYRLAGSDPVPVALIRAMVDLQPGAF